MVQGGTEWIQWAHNRGISRGIGCWRERSLSSRYGTSACPLVDIGYPSSGEQLLVQLSLGA